MPFRLIKSSGGGDATDQEDYPFKATMAGINKIKFLPGLINNILPANIFDEFDVSESGMDYFVLEMTSSQTRIVSAQILKRNDNPDPPNFAPGFAPEKIEIVLCLVKNKKIYPVIRQNITLRASMVGTTINENASLEDPPYIYWYTWIQ